MHAQHALSPLRNGAREPGIPRLAPILRLGRYRRGVAAFIANRTSIPFAQCLDIVEWNWRILIDAYDEGARFQEAGRRILATGGCVVPRSQTAL